LVKLHWHWQGLAMPKHALILALSELPSSNPGARRKFLINKLLSFFVILKRKSFTKMYEDI
jgi:hypothetical protein